MARITVRGIKPVRRELATGEVRTYWYHRATGKRLLSEPGTSAWLAEIERLDREAAKHPEPAVKSFAALWTAYTDSQEWKNLKPRTRSDYQAVRNWLGKGAERIIVPTISSSEILAARDKGARERGRRFGNYVLQVLRLVIAWGIPRDWLGKNRPLTDNPAAGVPAIKRPKHTRKVNRAWSLDEVTAFANAAPFQLLLPFALGLFAGMREGDALIVTWSALKADQLEWIASKNSEECRAPVTGVFRTIIMAAKARRGRTLQIALNSYGHAWSESGFRASFFKLVRKLVEEGKMAPGCTFHGLRSTIVTGARDTGSTDFQAAAAIGDRSTDMAKLYGADADRMAAQVSVLEAVQKRFGNINVENVSGKQPSKRRGTK